MKLVRRFILSYAGLIDVSVLKRYKTSFKHEFLLTSSFNRLNLFPSEESTQFRGMSEVQKKIFERLLEQGRESIARSTRDTIMTTIQNKLTDGSAHPQSWIKVLEAFERHLSDTAFEVAVDNVKEAVRERSKLRGCTAQVSNVSISPVTDGVRAGTISATITYNTECFRDRSENNSAITSKRVVTGTARLTSASDEKRTSGLRKRLSWIFKLKPGSLTNKTLRC